VLKADASPRDTSAATRQELWVVRADGRDPRRVDADPVDRAVWSPGDRLAYATQTGAVVVDADGLQPSRSARRRRGRLEPRRPVARLVPRRAGRDARPGRRTPVLGQARDEYVTPRQARPVARGFATIETMGEEGGWRRERFQMHADPTPPSPIPQLRTLQWVMPIAMSQQHGKVEVTILSVEAYDDGFVVNVRTDYPLVAALGRRMGEMPLTVADDIGGQYRARRPGGFGGGGPERMQWRAAYFFVPSLDARAGRLRLEAPEWQWLAAEEGSQQLKVVDAQPGPWVFSLDLAALPRAALHR
jgi:hypothetical protein